MSQYIHRTFVLGATPTVVPLLPQPVLCNVAYRETAGVAFTITLRGPDGDASDSPGANGLGLARDERITEIVLSGNGATVTVDARGPNDWLDPRFLSAQVSGTPNVNVAAVGGAPPNIAQETGGNLFAIAGNTASGGPLTGAAGHTISDLHADLQSIITLLGAGLPTALSSPGGNLKVHESGA